MLKVVKERYSPADWNIYAAQASDGDNFHDDMPRCLQLLDKDVLPICQYFAYVETTHGERFNDSHETPVWHGYNQVGRRHKNFAMRRVAVAGGHLPRLPRAVLRQRRGGVRSAAGHRGGRGRR